VTVFITILHVLLCFLLVGVVLLQHGKGADMGVALGAGGSQTVFGARGAGNFLTRLTTGVAVLFMFTSIFLSYFAGPESASNLLGQAPSAEAPIAPTSETAPAPAAADAKPGAAPEVPSGFEEIPAPDAGTKGR